MKDNIKVAAVQFDNYLNKQETAILNAEKYIEKANLLKADIIVFPELSSCGYAANPQMWQYGETANGPTVKWAVNLSKKYNIIIGLGFLEVEGEDFYNSYMIVDNDNVNIIRKQTTEIYTFKPFFGKNVIETKIGRIGIGICADNHKYQFLKKMKVEEPDLLLMPHAWATPFLTTKVISPKDINEAEKIIDSFPLIQYKFLNIGVVFVNMVGKMYPMDGLFGKLMSADNFRYQGFSKIIDANGNIHAASSNNEEMIISIITLSQNKSLGIKPKIYTAGWLHKGSWLIRKIIGPIDNFHGKKFYHNSSLRKELALKVTIKQ